MRVRRLDGAGRRLGAALVFALHLLMVLALPLADAGIEAATADDAAVRLAAPDEARRDASHDHFQCQFCRLLGQGAVAATCDARSTAGEAPAAVAAGATNESVTLSASPLPLGSRAPPLA
ncbi:MAG TPA: hypothetical protein VF192_13600 [Longimicrobiales bacterium]